MFMKKFKEELKKEFKSQLQFYQEFLWDARLFFLGLVLADVLNDVNTYMNGDMTFIHLLGMLVTGLVIVLVPFAYGIESKEEGVEQSENDSSTH